MNPVNPEILPDVRPLIDEILLRAIRVEASDIHFEPTGTGLEVRFRVDGLLETVEQLPVDVGRSAVLRLMVLAQLLTYRVDIPQEGRIRTHVPKPVDRALDLRLAIMPVAHGLRAVVRLPAELSQPKGLAELGLSEGVMKSLKSFGHADSGMLLVTGPAGSGKTTTIYALLQYIAAVQPGLSIISLEDPIERLLPGVTQIEVTPHGQLTYERALKSILRQDPQVLMLGEIRDVGTASLAVQAALSGHRLIATMHAGDPATALARMAEMGLEPYQLTSSVFGIVSQRLLRRKAAEGYRGRVPVAEFGAVGGEEGVAVRAAVLRRADAGEIKKLFAARAGHVGIMQVAGEMVAKGITDGEEVRRVLGEG